MSTRGHDPHAIDGKFPAPEQHFDVVVIGAGRSGTQAALDAAKAGRKVLLVDENPVSGALIGTDVPWFFGGRATTAVQNSRRMVETVYERFARFGSAHMTRTSIVFRYVPTVPQFSRARIFR